MMTTWDELTDLLGDPGDVRSPAEQAGLYDALLHAAPEQPPQGESAQRLAAALAEVDRTWLAALGEDPTRSRADIDRAVERCGHLRQAGGRSALPLRYARVELCTFFGERADALEQLRVARLFSFDDADAGATLAAARMHDDFSGVIRTTSGASKRPDADPAGTARSLAASLLPYLAQRRKVEAEDALMALAQVDVPVSLRIPLLGDQLEYLGLSGQWERGLALLRHTELSDIRDTTAWGLLNTAVGASLVLREANRAGYGSNALGSTISWTMSWGPSLKVTGWDTVVHAYDALTAFARTIAVRFDERNGNNGVSYRVESRMAGEASGLAARSYGTVTGTAVDEHRLQLRGALLKDVNELLVLARGYGLSSVHERAMKTAETVSRSLELVTDDSQLETVVALRIAFARLLLALGASERAERESLDTSELCLSQGWIELACASLATAARAAGSRNDMEAARTHWRRVHEQMGDWGTSRMKERLTVLTDAIGSPEASSIALVLLAEVTAKGVEAEPARASSAREVCRRARAELERCKAVPSGVAERIAAVEQVIAPYGRGRSGRHRGGGEETTAAPSRARRVRESAGG